LRPFPTAVGASFRPKTERKEKKEREGGKKEGEASRQINVVRELGFLIHAARLQPGGKKKKRRKNKM